MIICVTLQVLLYNKKELLDMNSSVKSFCLLVAIPEVGVPLFSENFREGFLAAI